MERHRQKSRFWDDTPTLPMERHRQKSRFWDDTPTDLEARMDVKMEEQGEKKPEEDLVSMGFDAPSNRAEVDERANVSNSIVAEENRSLIDENKGLATGVRRGFQCIPPGVATVTRNRTTEHPIPTQGEAPARPRNYGTVYTSEELRKLQHKGMCKCGRGGQKGNQKKKVAVRANVKATDEWRNSDETRGI
ncbi:hypothetical protein C8R44DRAFT_751835 [Mycena epipterygia]|nr:hypothetical protein C8R44DRAFT_751835 [Mycena epipterygia]